MKIKKILISQPKPKSEKSPYFCIEKKYNVNIDFHPFIKVEPVNAKEFRQQKIRILDYSAIIFNSRHSIDHFFRLATELRIEVPKTMKYFCVSEVVSHYLQKYVRYRKRKIFFSPTGKFHGLIEHFKKNKEDKYLFITSNLGNEESIETLKESDIDFKQAVMYQTVSCKIEEDIQNNYDSIVLFTPLGVNSLFENCPNFEQKEIKIGCFGKHTAEEVEKRGLKLHFNAPTEKCPSIIMALEHFIKENK